MPTVDFRLQALGLCNFVRGLGGLMKGEGAYIRGAYKGTEKSFSKQVT